MGETYGIDATLHEQLAKGFYRATLRSATRERLRSVPCGLTVHGLADVDLFFWSLLSDRKIVLLLTTVCWYVGTARRSDWLSCRRPRATSLVSSLSRPALPVQRLSPTATSGAVYCTAGQGCDDPGAWIEFVLTSSFPWSSPNSS